MRAPAIPSPRVLVLASRSPQRINLLTAWGVLFESRPADIDEEATAAGRSPADLALHLALEKARFIAAQTGQLTLGADTVAAVGTQVLGKPRDAQHATGMLRQLAGTTHHVITGVAVVDPVQPREHTACVTSAVTMRPLSDAEIHAYIATGLWEGKAGGYGLQDEQAGTRDPFIDHIDGDLSNVIGLPKEATLRLLREAGIF